MMEDTRIYMNEYKERTYEITTMKLCIFYVTIVQLTTKFRIGILHDLLTSH